MTPEERFERIEHILELQVTAQLRLTESITAMNQSITRYMDASDARMKRMEENLDGLIRVILAEHKNGKKQ